MNIQPKQLRPSETPHTVAVANDMAVDLSPEDIEAAYTRALAAVDAVEQAVPEWGGTADVADDGGAACGLTAHGSASNGIASSPDSPDSLQDDAHIHHDALPDDARRMLQPRQIIEAALFVGGEPLTAKRLMRVLGRESDVDTAERLITELNEEYRGQARPYDIRLTVGGYQLSLRTEFEDVRDRVYGRNPKEIKLSQEALEVLALVAYQQPVTCDQLEAAGKTNAAAVLRQLLRRQLVALQRIDTDPTDVTYTTTSRFLEVFGLRSLDDLPLPEDFALK